MTTERKYIIGLMFVLVFGAFLRLHDLGDRSLWLDETFSAWFSAQGWHYLWHDVPTFETHPPLYYSLLKLWRVFGSDEYTLRLFSTLVGLATIPLVFLCGRICGGGRVGLLAAFLFTCAKLEIYYSQDARPYTCFTLAMAIMVTAAAWLVKHPDEAARPLRQVVRTPRTLFAYLSLAVGLALLQWFQNLGFVFILPAGLFLIGWWLTVGRGNVNLFVNLACAVALAGLLYAPFIPTFIHQVTDFKGGFWLQAPTWTYLITQSTHLYGQTIDGSGAPLRVLLFAVIFLPVASFGLFRLFRRNPDRRMVAAAAMLLTASVGAWVVNVALTYLMQPVFMERTLLPLQMPWFVLLAMAIFALPKGITKFAVPVMCLMFLAGAVEYETRPDVQPNTIPRPWENLVEAIAKNDPHAPVVVLPNHAAMAMSYYEAKDHATLDMRPLPAPFPAVGTQYTYSIGGRGVPDVTAKVVDTTLDNLRAEPRFWLVTTGITLNAADNVPNEADNEIKRRLTAGYENRVVYQDRGATLLLYTRTGR